MAEVRPGRLAHPLPESGSVLIVGEAGIGKTTLIEASLAPRSERTVCLPLLRTRSAATLSLAVGRALGSDLAGAVTALSELADQHLVIEDLQWADEVTLAALESRVAHQPLTLSIRPELDPSGALRTRLVNAGCVTKTVPPLTSETLALLVPGLDAISVDQLMADSGGNPALALALAHHPDQAQRLVSDRLRACDGVSLRALAALYIAGVPLPTIEIPGHRQLHALGLIDIVAHDSSPVATIRHGAIGRAALQRAEGDLAPAAWSALLDDSMLTRALRGRPPRQTHPPETVNTLLTGLASIVGAVADASTPLVTRARALPPGSQSDLLRRMATVLHKPRSNLAKAMASRVPEPRAVGPALAAALEADVIIDQADVGQTRAGTSSGSSPVNQTKHASADVGELARNWATAEADLVGGRPRRAASRAAQVVRDDQNQTILSALARVTMAWAFIDAGVDEALPLGNWTEESGMMVAARTEVEALAALRVGNYQAAAERFDVAVRSWGHSHQRAAFRCRWAAAECRRRGGEVDDALARLGELEVEAERLDLRPLLAKIRASQRATGARRRNARTETSAQPRRSATPC